MQENSVSKTLIIEEIKAYIIVTGKDMEIICYSDKYDDLFNIIKYYTNQGYFINSIEFNTISISNKKSMTEIDYSYIHKIKKYLDVLHHYTNINFTYESGLNANYEDYFSMVESLKWYRSLVLDNDLSPVEKLTYAYDICKTIHYKQSGLTSKDISNDNTLHLFFKTGNIVCLGYNRLLEEMLLGVEGLKVSDFVTYEFRDNDNGLGHSRGIVRIDDDKYDIHGIYCFDVTFDSYHEEYAKTYGKRYDAFSGYRYFLVPIYKYKNFFKYGTYPRIFSGRNNAFKEKYLTKKRLDEIVYNSKQNNKKVNTKVINEGIRPLVEDLTVSELYKYLNCERPDEMDFFNIIINVRLCEGFDVDSINNGMVYGILTENKNEATIFRLKDTRGKK